MEIIKINMIGALSRGIPTLSIPFDSSDLYLDMLNGIQTKSLVY